MNILITHYYVVNGIRSNRISYEKKIENLEPSKINIMLEPFRNELKEKHNCEQINLEYIILEDITETQPS